MNRSLSVYIANAEDITSKVDVIQKAFPSNKVIANGPTWEDLNGRSVQLVTVLSVDKKEFTLAKGRKPIRDLEKAGSIMNW